MKQAYGNRITCPLEITCNKSFAENNLRQPEETEVFPSIHFNLRANTTATGANYRANTKKQRENEGNNKRCIINARTEGIVPHSTCMKVRVVAVVACLPHRGQLQSEDEESEHEVERGKTRKLALFIQ
jgi:hypothetical protein